MKKNIDNKSWRKFLKKININSKKIINFLEDESSKWKIEESSIDVSGASIDVNNLEMVEKIYESAWKRINNFYKKLSPKEKNVLLLIDNILWTSSNKVVYNFQVHKNFFIFLNNNYLNCNIDKKYNAKFKGIISLNILIEICQMYKEKNLKDKMMIWGDETNEFQKIYYHNNVLIYGNGFTKALGLEWAKEDNLKSISQTFNNNLLKFEDKK